jgi:hypothetical protein
VNPFSKPHGGNLISLLRLSTAAKQAPFEEFPSSGAVHAAYDVFICVSWVLCMFCVWLLRLL